MAKKKLTQSKVTTFESTRFILEDGIIQDKAIPLLAIETPPTKVLAKIDSSPFEVPKCAFLSILLNAFKFT